MTELTEEQKSALNVARYLAEAGVPVFVAPPREDPRKGQIPFVLPTGWEQTKADPARVDRWKPGWALCAVMGHTVDAIDIDPQNGGTIESLTEALGGKLPTVYGRASTPSGGEHYLVASIGERKIQDVLPGIDFQGGNPEGVGRTFIYLAPTVKASKSSAHRGQMLTYKWELNPDLEALNLVGVDTSVADFARFVREWHDTHNGASGLGNVAEYEGDPYDELDEEKQREARDYVDARLTGWLKTFKDARYEEFGEQDRDEETGRGWDAQCYRFAWSLAKMVASPWTDFTVADAEQFMGNVTDDEELGAYIAEKWAGGSLVDSAALEPVDTPPWLERFDPADDFALVDPPAVTVKALPDLPKQLDDSYMTMWMARKGLDNDWCWSSGLGWMKWDGRRWTPRSDEESVEAVRKVMSRISPALVKKYNLEIADDKVLKLAVSAANGLLSSGKVNAVAKLMKGFVAVRANSFDTQNYLLNVGNGVVDLRNGSIGEHQRRYLMTKLTEADYVPGATHPDWDTCLQALEPDVMAWMQLRFGQAITGWPTSDDILPVGVGNGSNGKSTLLAGLFSALGEHITLVPDKLLRASASDHPTELMSLLGVRVAIIEETPEAGKLNVQRLKAVLGTERITARGMYKDNVSWKPTHSLFLMTNYTPQIHETDNGTWRRLALVKYNKTFVKQDNFRANVSSGVGGRREAVLAWLVAGAVAWHEGGETLPSRPSQVERDTDEWRGGSDMLRLFMEEGYIHLEDPNARVATSDFHDAFTAWLKSRGQAAWGMPLIVSRIVGSTTFPGVTRTQTEKIDSIHRYDGAMSELPKRPWVFEGISFGPPTATRPDDFETPA